MRKKDNRQISPKRAPSPPSLVLHPVESLSAYRNYLVSKKQEDEERQRVEQEFVGKQKAFFLSGHCYACGKEVDFLVPVPKGSPNCQGYIPNWRESLICPNCKLSNRQRASFQLLMDFIKPVPDSKIYIAEQSTPFFRQICRKFPHTIGSEYLGTDLPFGAQKDGIRNEDLTALTFVDNELDYIVVLDVFEHIPNFEKAFQECWRTLKPQGMLLFSVPFERNSEKNIVRAIRTPEGKTQFLSPPPPNIMEIQSKDNVLRYQIFGWEILNQLREIGFKNAKSIFFWSKELGYLGEDQGPLCGSKGRDPRIE